MGREQAAAGYEQAEAGSSRWRRVGAGMTSFASAGLDLLLPRLCPGCARPGSWCHYCAATLAGRPRAVAVPDVTVDRLASLRLAVPPVHALTRYGGPVRAAIVAGKEKGRRDLPPRLGRALGAGLAFLSDAAVVPDGLWIVPAPTRRASARARGGDPVLAMARAAAAHLAELGRATGVAPCLFLARRTKDSVGLDAAARAENLAGAVRFDPRGAPPRGASVVLIDDVLTSGATMAGSYQVLHDGGITLAGVMVVASAAPRRPALLGGAENSAEGSAENAAVHRNEADSRRYPVRSLIRRTQF